MGKPTLLVQGNLAETPGGPRQAELDGYVPIDYITRWLRRHMPEFGGRPVGGQGWDAADRILAVQARTGAGKSTVMPAYILRLLRGEQTGAAAVRTVRRSAQYSGPGVLCTQPRVLTARTLAEGLDEDGTNYPELVLGLSVGYMTGPASLAPVGGLVYSTIGVLTARLKRAAASYEEAAAFFAAYRFIILDEVHERSIDLDLAMAQIKGLFARYRGDARLPFVLLTSATFDPAAVAAYYGVGPANRIAVSGSTFPVAIHYPTVGTNDYMATAAEVALRIHAEHSADPPAVADVLIFLPGHGEMKAVAELLRAESLRVVAATAAATAAAAAADVPPPAPPRGFEVYMVERKVVQEAGEDYRILTAGADAATGDVLPPRRIILSTNVAETGLTIPTLGYVIDPGWNRQSEYYPAHDLHVVVNKPTPQSRSEQRRGRTGRLHPGDYYPLYTAGTAAALPPQQFPEIVTADLGAALLDLVRLQADRDAALRQMSPSSQPPAEYRAGFSDLLTAPPAAAVWGALERAYLLGFVSEAAPLGPVMQAAKEVNQLAALAVAAAAPPGDVVVPEAVAATAGTFSLPSVLGWGLTPLGELARRLSGQSFQQLEGLRIVLGAAAWGASLFDAVALAALLELEPSALVPRRPSRDTRLSLTTLRHVLPTFVLLFNIVGGAGGDDGGYGAATWQPAEVGLNPDDEHIFRIRLAMGDDFLEHLLVFSAFRAEVGRTRGDPAALRKWAAEADVEYAGLLLWAEHRERILTALVAAGVNVFGLVGADSEALAASNPRQWVARLTRLKHVLYDALRHRVLTYDAAADVYRNRAGVAVLPPPLFSDKELGRLARSPEMAGAAPPKPHRLLADRVSLALPPRSRLLCFRAYARRISVLDGFVPHDPAFVGDAPLPPPPPPPP